MRIVLIAAVVCGVGVVGLMTTGCGAGPSGCDVTNCAGCCSSSGVCLGGQIDSACGQSGNLCDFCVTGQTCSVGRCVAGTNGGGGGSGCTTSASCTTTTDICYQNSCSSGLGRAYKITVQSVAVPTLDPASNSAWDAFGGAPDLKVCILVNGSSVACTSEASDVFTASWSQSTNITVLSNTIVGVRLVDVDATVDDEIETFSWNSAAAFIGNARNGGFSGKVSNGIVQWNFSITAL